MLLILNSTEQREKILKLENEKSIAIQHDKFKTLGRNELREIVKGTEVVYIYQIGRASCRERVCQYV